MAVAGSHKLILDREIEMYDNFLTTAIFEIKNYIKFNTTGYRKEGQTEEWIYQNRITSFQYNELVDKADKFAKKLTELRDSKRSYLGSF